MRTQVVTKDIKEVQKKIREDWVNALPNLAMYAQNKLYKIVGPVVIGIELIRLPRTPEYRPHFVCYPLWKENVKKCLMNPIMLMEFYDKKGLQFTIPYMKHNLYFFEALQSVKRQIPFSFDNDLSLKDFSLAIDEYSNTPPLSASPNSYLQAELQKARFGFILYTGSDHQAEDMIDQLRMRNWNLEHFKMCGIDVKHWLKSLQETVDHRDEFLAQIQANKQDKKLQKLPQSELVS